MKESRNYIRLVAAAVGIITLLVYLPALNCGFINLDDPFYITNNPFIKSLDPGSIRRIFTESHLAAWLPLTYLSFALDHLFWGDNPTGYHLTNIILHALNAGLVALLTHRILIANDCVLQKWHYPVLLLFAGLLFSVHPLRVESVAWASARKDVLNGLFTIAAILSYLSYVRRKAAGEPRYLIPYALALACFVLSLLAKQVSVTLPVILLLLDWYPLDRIGKGRWRGALIEKIPFGVISLVITALTIYFAGSGKSLISMRDMPFYVRGVISGNAIFEYCRLWLFPVGISPYFVVPRPLPYSYLVRTVLVVLVLLYMSRDFLRRKGWAVTWFCFIVLLAPMLAFIQAGDDLALAARYTYLPSIAPGIAVAAGIALLSRRLKPVRLRPVLIASLLTAALIVAVNIGISLQLIKVWKDTGSFWSRVIEIDPLGRAYGDRGVFYLINGKSGAAVADFNAAIAIAAKSGVGSIYNLYAFRGVALSDIGRYEEAVADFDKAIELYPHPTYFQQRGAALKALGRFDAANEDLRRAGPNPPAIDWFSKD
ncbi:transmembrane and TPR repeat-containing protein 3 [Geobacter sp. OR-1]|uniref:tetratricopeptide repeat protein n=1 Tax=Geobacter sp. OR-1 TaxID=1266765 RepID=UPI00054229DF|nr:tetratricopeptide repeat protein [Geobacter sp. OR-1]GAM10543.1 transmembrane and TPR repeat-containing protein 3 [Geobacter sp. OR-1]